LERFHGKKHGKFRKEMKKIIPIAGPSITKKEIDYVYDAIKNGWYENAFDYIKKFEKKFKKYVNRRYAISLPSCTSALHLSLLSLGVGPGDEVIVSDATWIASAAPIIYLGAKPVFADINPKTWCISYATIKPLVNKKTKAIIAVNLYGNMPEYDELKKIGIPIIEDAAESLGSKYKNVLSGKFGITSCFSFHGTKTVTTGEGGMLVTDSKKIYEKCMILRDHGRKPNDVLYSKLIGGYKYKMSNIQAAVGLAQIERINELIKKKREIFNWYFNAFKDCDNISLNIKQKDVYNSYWLTTCLINKQNLNKNKLIKRLMDYGIHTRPFFNPLSSQPAFKKVRDSKRASEQNNVSYRFSKIGINLPSSFKLKRSDVTMVKKTLVRILEN